MSLARCRCVALLGVEARLVDVEVHLGGMPGFVLVGLPDATLHESRDRVRAAVLSSAEAWPQQRITADLHCIHAGCGVPPGIGRQGRAQQVRRAAT